MNSRKILIAAIVVLVLGATAAIAKVSHAGWYSNMHLIMDQGPAGQSHTMRGLADKHNEILGGYGSDTIYGGNVGDVLWGDYHPSGQPTSQISAIYAGNGKNFIYTDHGTNFIHTGTNPGTYVLAFDGQGNITCGDPHQEIDVSHRSKPRFKLTGCGNVKVK